MTDNYEFMRSSQSQSADKYSPYVRKDWNHVNDINNGVYTNSSMSLVQFDLSSIFNSSRLVDTNDMFFTLPIQLVCGYDVTGTANVFANPATVVSGGLCQLKSGFHNLIHQADLQINGKTIEQTQPYLNKFIDFKLLSEMSVNDLQALGPSLGYSNELDNPFSVRWNNATPAKGGNGLCNNRPFSKSSDLPNTKGYGPNKFLTPSPLSNCNNTANVALSQRIMALADTTTAVDQDQQNIYGTAINGDNLMDIFNLRNEFKPFYSIDSNAMVINDVAVIRLRDLFDSMGNIGLTKRFDAVVRLYVNTGAIQVTGAITDGNPENNTYAASLGNSTFSNTCPLVVNHLPFTAANGGLTTTANKINAGCFLVKTPVLTINSMAFPINIPAHPMAACRCYYSSIELKPQLAIKYIEENRNKKVVYRSIISNQTTFIGAGNSYSQLIQSGITHPLGLVIMPFIDSSVAVTGGFSPSGSPFDTNLAHPLSLTNLQVQVGGVNVLSNTLFYTYENFLEQVHLFESLTSSDIGISCGLISKQFWEVNRTYFVNLGRGTTSDNLTPRNIQVSFNNNNRVAINCLMFVVYLDEFEIDIETGLVKK